MQDVVTRGGKLVFLYKRPGSRVVVNDLGHMMVSPSSIEASIQQSPGGMHGSLHGKPCLLGICMQSKLAKLRSPYYMSREGAYVAMQTSICVVAMSMQAILPRPSC